MSAPPVTAYVAPRWFALELAPRPHGHRQIPHDRRGSCLENPSLVCQAIHIQGSGLLLSGEILGIVAEYKKRHIIQTRNSVGSPARAVISMQVWLLTHTCIPQYGSILGALSVANL
jgi:hypothetical protein